MIPAITSVEPRNGHRLHLVFDDGTRGEVDVAELVPFRGVFAPLENSTEFRRVRVDPDSGTVAWPNGADLDPLILYAKIKGIDVEELLDARSPAQG